MKQLKHAIRKAGEKPRFTYDCRKPALYDINDIRRMLPHRPPFLLVDRIFYCDKTDVGRHQERHDERTLLRRTLPQRTRHAGRADRRGMAQCSGILVLNSVPDPGELFDLLS